MLKIRFIGLSFTALSFLMGSSVLAAPNNSNLTSNTGNDKPQEVNINHCHQCQINEVTKTSEPTKAIARSSHKSKDNLLKANK